MSALVAPLPVCLFLPASRMAQSEMPFEKYNSPATRARNIHEAIARSLPCAQVEVVHVAAPSAPSLALASVAHEVAYLEFLETGFASWAAQDHRDPDFFGPGTEEHDVPSLVLGNASNRDASARAGSSACARAAFYLTDKQTPLFASLAQSLSADLAVVAAALAALQACAVKQTPACVYALTTHPGHHASAAGAAGYCYVNYAAVFARSALSFLEEGRQKVAVIDVDYHCGNGTVGIFWDEPNVLVCSIHADPEIEYPYTSGFADQSGGTAARGATLCLPLAPGATWARDYAKALSTCVEHVKLHTAQLLVVSLGVDTMARDPVAVPGAGFDIQLEDYLKIGAALRECGLPTVFIQEGGYDLDRVGDAVANTLKGFCHG